MGEAKSTIRSRELGDALRWAMERAELNGRRMAVLLGWSESRVSRLLTGRLGATEVDVAMFLTVCGVRGRERDRLFRLVREQNTPGWLQQHNRRLPEQVRTLIDHENRAVEINDFEPLFVPGLLQTQDYAHALLERAATITPDEIQDRVAARMTRRSLFSREKPPNCVFYLHEFVLRLPVGGREVMSDQLHHLLRQSVRPHITIRVIPAALGAHAGNSGSCRLMEFSEFRPVAYVEEESAGLFMEEPVQVALYRKIFGSFATMALDEGQSKDLIARLAIELYADGEDHDEHG
jgi:Domain of unknown function (DUF5753)/Helix-turn-helix domain